ncbi:MAG: right-handed parallel beta-helix repeat-containing protein, partial [Blastopirellula sp. JB062]
HGMSIDRNGRHGVNLVDCLEDPRVCDSILTYNGQVGLRIIGGHDIVVSANHFEENLDAVHCLDSYNLCMSGNNLDDHLRDGVVIENTYGSIVSGNMIEECQATAVRLDRDCYGITVSANVIAHNAGGGVDLADATGCAVSANTFVLCAKRGLTISPKSSRITVTGNSFSNSSVGQSMRRTDPVQDDSGGVFLQSTSDIVLTGNGFSGLSGAAVQTDGKCSKIVIVGNNCVDLFRGSERSDLPSFQLGEVDELVLENNHGAAVNSEAVD